MTADRIDGPTDRRTDSTIEFESHDSDERRNRRLWFFPLAQCHGETMRANDRVEKNERRARRKERTDERTNGAEAERNERTNDLMIGSERKINDAQ